MPDVASKSIGMQNVSSPHFKLANNNLCIVKISSEYPLVLPNILVTMEDTEKYAIHGSQADAEWVATTAADNGYIRLGKDRRLMGISVGHEMHCIRSLRVAVAYPLHPSANVGHFSHCLNYLRLYILCDPDLTLEKFDPLEGNFSLPRSGATHICKDWRVVYDELSKAFKEDVAFIGRNDINVL